MNEREASRWRGGREKGGGRVKKKGRMRTIDVVEKEEEEKEEEVVIAEREREARTLFPFLAQMR
jgi:hypothetical protein